MNNWKEFETDTSNYIKKLLTDYDVEVEKFGKSDSTVPDIEIKLKNNKSFFVETKMPHSQTSQFVVQIIDERFIYGQKNHFLPNKYSNAIIDELNRNFSYYKEARQSGIVLPIPDDVAFGFIMANMKNKKVEFIVTFSNNKELIIPVEKLSDYFNVKTILRRKKSGSRPISKRYYNDFKEQISKKFNNDYYIIFENNKRLYLKTNFNLLKENLYIDSKMLKNKNYYLSEKEEGIYEIRLTSSTNNPNVIFEIFLKEIDFDLTTVQNLLDYINDVD